jgi:poly-gamma-glutamate synthesis protein (capsule biosynthesis protein)
MGVSVIIGGDVYPGGKHMTFFEQGAAVQIFGPLLSEFLEADFTIVNLESPLYDGNSPILKDGPVLKASTKSINGMKSAGICAVNLANNHVFDHGEAGLRSTMATCARAGIVTIGAGPNLEDARRIQVISAKGVRIGFLGLAEHEFSIAGHDSWGANPLDLIDYVRNVKKNCAEYDYLIVLLHGGCEHYPFPSPRLMDTCRFLVEEGATAVVCQHSHCAGCYEEYLGGLIVYGQGNLLFEDPNEGEAWHEGFLVKLEISKDGSSGFGMVPYQQSKGGMGIKSFSSEEERDFVSKIQVRSENILRPGFVREVWNDYRLKRRHYYLSKILGHGCLTRRLNRTGAVTRTLYSRDSLLAVRNALTCESHREVLESIFDLELQIK